MADTLTDRLRRVLPEMSPEDIYAIAAFAEYLTIRRQSQDRHERAELSTQEHARVLAAINAVSALSMEQGPAVSNRDHDQYLFATVTRLPS